MDVISEHHNSLLESTALTKPPTRVVITPLNEEEARIEVVGTAPYLSNKFSAKKQEAMRLKQMEGSQQSKKRRSKPPRVFIDAYLETIHVSTEGWYGAPASAFRQGMIDACRVPGYTMTRAKMTLFVIPDGYDKDDGQGLVRIYGDGPRYYEIPGTLADGSTDLIVRARWDKWSMKPLLRWDADQFQASDVINLLARMGVQVGIGSGRPFSKKSAGMGMGTFKVNA